jgi:hypothetical protein
MRDSRFFNRRLSPIGRASELEKGEDSETDF